MTTRRRGKAGPTKETRRRGWLRLAGSVAMGCSSVLLLQPSTVRAQGTYRDLSGTVEDDHHEPLRGAVVYLEDQATHGVMTFLTDRSGHFSFKRLHGELDYQVWAMYRGDRSKTKTISQFDTKPAPVVVLEIKPHADE